MSDSTWNDPRITAYVLDELSADQRKEFELELAGNAKLAAAVDEARSLTGQLEELYAAENTPTLDSERRKTLVTPPAKRSWKGPLLALAVAASLLLLIGGPMVMNRNRVLRIGQTGDSYGRTAESVITESDSEADSVIATNEELLEYGKKIAKGTPLEGLGPKISARQTLRSRLERQSSVTSSDSSQVQAKAETQRSDRMARTGRVVLGGEVNSDAEIRNTIASKPNQKPSAKEKLNGGFGGGQRPNLETTANVDVADELLHYPAKSAEGARKKEVIRRTVEARFSFSQSSLPSVTKGRPALPSESIFSEADHLGRGPGIPGDRFDPITDNPFKRVVEHSLSTFSVDVDTASYSKTRDFLTRANQLPRPDAVRIEELINYFDYDYDPPSPNDQHPFSAHTVVTSCPWNEEHRLVRIAIKGKVIEKDQRPRCNLVFLLDTSGSMNATNKLPLVIDGMKMLLKQLNKKDRVAITVYAGSAGLVLDSTPAKKKKKIRNALTKLSAGGSTNGGAGIALAYQTARDNFIKDGVNRVILCTDGDFNVGETGTDSLVRMVETEAKGGIFLTVLGFGMGNHNDSMLEQISGRGNGNYAYIDSKNEARKVLVQQTNSTLVTIAKDVKLQIEFNPQQVSSYRLIGYENRVLAKEDFNDDKKDAGEIGAGHAVTALYEIVPAGLQTDESRPKVDDLKYQSKSKPTDAADSDEMLTLKLRYKQPDGDTSTLVEFPVKDNGGKFSDADKDVRFAVAVAGFGMQLRRSEYKGSWTLSDVQRVAETAKGEDEHRLRTEFIDLVKKASQLMGQE